MIRADFIAIAGILLVALLFTSSYWLGSDPPMDYRSFKMPRYGEAVALKIYGFSGQIFPKPLGSCIEVSNRDAVFVTNGAVVNGRMSSEHVSIKSRGGGEIVIYASWFAC